MNGKGREGGKGYETSNSLDPPPKKRRFLVRISSELKVLKVLKKERVHREFIESSGRLMEAHGPSILARRDVRTSPSRRCLGRARPDF